MPFLLACVGHSPRGNTHTHTHIRIYTHPIQRPKKPGEEERFFMKAERPLRLAQCERSVSLLLHVTCLRCPDWPPAQCALLSPFSSLPLQQKRAKRGFVRLIHLAHLPLASLRSGLRAFGLSKATLRPALTSSFRQATIPIFVLSAGHSPSSFTRKVTSYAAHAGHC